MSLLNYRFIFIYIQNSTFKIQDSYVTQNSYNPKVDLAHRTYSLCAPPLYHDSYSHNTSKWLMNASFTTHLCLVVLLRANPSQMPSIRSTVGLEEAGPMGGIEGSKTPHLGDQLLSVRRKTLVPQRLRSATTEGAP